tara:strand:+ start:23222 stop:23695 length:474 start_codon:yes stop_codon:yes gene_type:complete
MTTKKRQRWDLSSDVVYRNFEAFIATMRLSGKRPLVEIVPEHRNLDQNAMIYALYKQIGEQCEDESIKEIKLRCKLDYGVPILCADDQDFCKFYQAIGHLDYEQQKEAMKFVPVTSLMNKGQASRYIDEIIRDHSQQGYSMIHPNDLARYQHYAANR